MTNTLTRPDEATIAAMDKDLRASVLLTLARLVASATAQQELPGATLNTARFWVSLGAGGFGLTIELLDGTGDCTFDGELTAEEQFELLCVYRRVVKQENITSAGVRAQLRLIFGDSIEVSELLNRIYKPERPHKSDAR